MHTAKGQEYFSEGRGIATLWAGVLLAPLGWVIQLSVNYAAIHWICTGGSAAVLHITSAAALLLALSGLAVAARNWRLAGKSWPGDASATPDRSRFLAVSGLLSSAFFSLVIVTLWMPTLLLHPCLT